MPDVHCFLTSIAVVAQLEKENNAQLALIDHNKAIAESVLKKGDIKLKAGRKKVKINRNSSSYVKVRRF